MARAGLTPILVISEAGDLADEVGFDNLTISGLAQRLGVKQPTLYKHVTGTSGLHREMAVLAKLELADVMRRSAVGKAGDDALVAIAIAYRNWAVEHPGRYAATVRAAEKPWRSSPRCSTVMASPATTPSMSPVTFVPRCMASFRSKQPEVSGYPLT